jgi:hypothetical protein
MAKFQDALKYTAILQTTKESLIQQYGENHIARQYPDWIVDDTLIGIEIEVERVPNLIAVPFWQVVPDGSLRDDGVELRTLAFPATWAPAMLRSLYDGLKATNKKYNFSERTSIHIHLDFRNHEVFDLVKLLLVYSVFDRLLFKKVCPTRSKNVYCVSLSDMLVGSNIYSECIERYKKSPDSVTWEDMHVIANKLCNGKYAAINPLNLFVRRQDRGDHTGSGSIEFRHLHGTDDFTLICRWIKLLLYLKQYIAKTSFTEIQKQIEVLNTSSEYQNYTYTVFKELTPFLIPYNEHDANIKLIAEGVTAAKQILAHPVLSVDGIGFLKSKLANVLQKNIIAPIADREKEAEEQLRQALRRNVIDQDDNPRDRIARRIVRAALQPARLGNDVAERPLAMPVAPPVDIMVGDDLWNPPPIPQEDNQVNVIPEAIPEEEINMRNIEMGVIRFDPVRGEWVRR